MFKKLKQLLMRYNQNVRQNTERRFSNHFQKIKRRIKRKGIRKMQIRKGKNFKWSWMQLTKRKRDGNIAEPTQSTISQPRLLLPLPPLGGVPLPL